MAQTNSVGRPVRFPWLELRSMRGGPPGGAAWESIQLHGGGWCRWTAFLEGGMEGKGLQLQGGDALPGAGRGWGRGRQVGNPGPGAPCPLLPPGGAHRLSAPPAGLG